MKRARPPLAQRDMHRADALLTTGDVSRLLRVHPKHVYRLLRRGLPGHRVGGEWRFLAEEVLRWSGTGPATPEPELRRHVEPPSRAVPILLAANGDVVVEYLLARLTASGRPLFGHVQADRGGALELLKERQVLAAGCHGKDIPGALEEHRLAFIHLVDRQVGIALRRGVRARTLRQLSGLRLASRPITAGVRTPFDAELRRQGLDPEAVHGTALVLRSHRDIVCAVARGEADVGLASVAWAHRVGLEWIPLCREPYGLLVRADSLGEPSVVQLCEVAQSAEFRREVGDVCGYEARLVGAISYLPSPSRPRSEKRSHRSDRVTK